MVGGLTAVILLSTLHVIRTLKVPHQTSLTETKLGDNVTLSCRPSDSERSLFYWYKMNFGHMIQRVLMGSFNKLTLEAQFQNSRYDVKKVGNGYALEIKNVSKDDEATYFCQVGAAYTMEFINVTFLAVNEPKQMHQDVNVRQSSDVEFVSLGTAVKLHCSLLSKNNAHVNQCPDENRVYWYRAGSESHPGAIYKSRSTCDDPAGGSCFYHLSKAINKSSDAGTYYCAVLTCGEILFGKGTKVEIKSDLQLMVIILGALLACSVLVNITLILARRKQKPVCDHCKGEVPASQKVLQDGSAVDHQSHVDADEDGINYVALDFPSRKAKRWKNNRESSEDCTYSSMK
ncbi:uncharacterized protein LOC133446779 [Cololabis saira]|uniref:uncharacterized protein LOC133446779 n=1 Tax=Cololabis saira TaxID=129043 RepID=UPI002AD41262|nr:uncharacterized protein LOC133446779 [Cololabis saira]